MNMNVAGVSLILAIGSFACTAPASTGASQGGTSTVETPEQRAVDARRPVTPTVNGERVHAGISYGPYREGQRPGGPDPSEAELFEDLRILAPHWNMIRIYGSTGPAEPILRLIREHELPLRVMLGAWINPEARRDEDGAVIEVLEDNRADNQEQVREAIRLARDYEDVVFAVNIGNESQVFWSAHRTAPEVLIGYLREVRAAIAQPVTTADDYNFWNKPESHLIADEVDFIVLHAYAMWNMQPLEDAVAWTRQIVDVIAAEHPDLEIFLGETGWATELNPDASGDEGERIIGAAGQEEQRIFYQGFTAYAEEVGLSYFYFEAFDEPWKGGPDPRGIEKHWGLFGVDRTPNLAVTSLE